MSLCSIQWNPSCEATPFAPEKWPFKRGGLSTGVEINTFMFRFTVSSGLSRGVASRQGGLSKGVPLYLTFLKLLNGFASNFMWLFLLDSYQDCLIGGAPSIFNGIIGNFVKFLANSLKIVFYETIDQK